MKIGEKITLLPDVHYLPLLGADSLREGTKVRGARTFQVPCKSLSLREHLEDTEGGASRVQWPARPPRKRPDCASPGMCPCARASEHHG